MRYSDEDLRRMKARRRELVADWGDKGQRHPMARAIGGLNPAAQELHRLRGQIAEAERERRGPAPRLTEIPGRKRSYGLKFDIEYVGRRGKLGTDNFGRWYVVVGEGPEATFAAGDFKTRGEAAKAFVQLSKSSERDRDRRPLTINAPAQATILWIGSTGGVKGYGTAPNYVSAERLVKMGLAKRAYGRQGQYQLTALGKQAYDELRAARRAERERSVRRSPFRNRSQRRRLGKRAVSGT